MKPMKAENANNSNQRRINNRLIRFAILAGIGILGYYSYCFGLWGGNNLLLQYIFQCSCPVFSEEWRYPRQVDVIVSACRESWVDLSPSGRLLYVREKKLVFASNYLLDLQTMKRVNITDQPYSMFLTDELGLVESGLENYIIDRTTGKQISIQQFRYSRPDAQVNSDTNLDLLAESLRASKYVFLIEDQDIVVALVADFSTRPEHNFLAGRYDIPGYESDKVEEFLRGNHVSFQTVTSFPDEAVSPNGRFMARHEGIFLIETNQKIVEGVHLVLRGWTNGGRGVIYSPRYGGPCLIDTNFGFLDDSACFFEVPQPVLLLKVPEEYLSPTETP